MSVYHKYRIFDNGLKGAQLINGVDADSLILKEGDNYVLDGRAFSVMASFVYSFSGLTCYMYIVKPDPDLQEILDFIGL
jgi:hypothetical protein